MAGKELTLYDQNASIIMSGSESKDTYSRLKKYCNWLAITGSHWYAPNMEAYRDHLLQRLAPSSVKAHLATVRGQYKRLLRQRELFFAILPDDVLQEPFDIQKAYVDELMSRLENAVHPELSHVKTTQKQDRADSEHLRLSERQASELMSRPVQVHGNSLLALRDTAIIGLLLATGIRVDELVSLEVDDLRQSLDGELALLVREGKGNKQRVIPYGENDGVLLLVDDWLQAAGIENGKVFQSFDRRTKSRELSVRAVQYMLANYPININGKERAVKPHDLRRTYARREHDAGTPLIAIQQNLGHESLDTTRQYIGVLDAKQRRARAVYDWQSLRGKRLM